MEEEKVLEINPKKCYFIARYSDGKIVKGNALSNDAWCHIPEGITSLKYELSNDSEIQIHKHEAYTVHVDAEDKTFYAIDVRCLSGDEIVTYRINLRHVPGTDLKIGDVIIKREAKVGKLDSSWKKAG